MKSRIRLERIKDAARIIDPVFLNTPQFQAESLGSILGCRLVLKIETLNPIRSFKGRGASFLVAEIPNGSRLVCASAGNFGQAMAYACRAKEIPLIVYASVNASRLKIDRMRGFGAEVRLYGEDFDAAKLEAARAARVEGMRFVEDTRDLATVEGAGTIAVELLHWPERLDAVVIALGNGAMLTGMGRWLKAHAPETRVIGVSAEGAPAMAESWRAGRIIQHDRMDTIADGIGVRVPISEALEDMRTTVDDVMLVSEEAMLKAMRLLHEHVGLVVEPSGAAGVAALVQRPERFKDRLVGAVICGGNLTREQMSDWLDLRDDAS